MRNVRGELAKLALLFRSWVSTADRDATLQDARVVASIHRACHKGRIDEVRVSNAIRYINFFIVPNVAFTADANTVGLWHLDEGSGTSASDASPSANTGSLLNNPTWAADSPFAAPDTTPPVISGVNANNLLTTSAKVAWSSAGW